MRRRWINAAMAIVLVLFVVALVQNVGEEEAEADVADRIKRECEKLNASFNKALFEPDHSHFALTHGLLYCWNHKSASTSVASVLAEVTGAAAMLNRTDLYRLPGHLRPRSEAEFRDSLEAASSVVKMTVVRHPQRRLVSAYRDRFVVHPDSYQSRKYSGRMRGARPPSSAGTSPSRPPPLTFAQFVRFILEHDDGDDDSHWEPCSSRCSVCAVDWDVVVRVESMDEDWDRLRGMVPVLKDAALPRLNSASLASSEALVRAHLMQLSEKDLAGIRHKYRHDFRLFGYKEIDLRRVF